MNRQITWFNLKHYYFGWETLLSILYQADDRAYVRAHLRKFENIISEDITNYLGEMN